MISYSKKLISKNFLIFRIVLNKADMVNQQQFVRVYGALMWSLGKVLKSPEVPRIYIGSFWNQPLRFEYNRKLFEAEKHDLLKVIFNATYKYHRLNQFLLYKLLKSYHIASDINYNVYIFSSFTFRILNPFQEVMPYVKLMIWSNGHAWPKFTCTLYQN